MSIPLLGAILEDISVSLAQPVGGRLLQNIEWEQ
jgi:hypothetical protein